VSIEVVTLLLFGSMALLLALGLPVAFAFGGTAIIFVLWLWGPEGLSIVSFHAIDLMSTIVMVAIPLFIFMACVLERSGLADALYSTMHLWLGPLRGGLAMGTVLICTIFAAMSGGSAAGTITMGIIALPAMLKRNYNKRIATGPIMAGGALGILIPPSVPMIFYGVMAQMSVGQLFMGGILPGLILSSLFCLYIGIRSWLQPDLAPSVPPEERVSWRGKFVLLRGIVLPALLIFSVLGSIFLGVATPTEAAAVGAFGSLVCAAVHRRLNRKLVTEAGLRTLRMTCMVMWILVGAFCYTVTYNALGGQELIRNLLIGLEVNRWFILIAMQLTYFFLGMILEPLAIIMLTVPVYLPVITQLGFNPLWFGILFFVNMEMAFLTPPFGFTLFYMRALAPKEITMGDIYRSIIPFVTLQAIGLAIVMIFPQLALWLPSLMLR